MTPKKKKEPTESEQKIREAKMARFKRIYREAVGRVNDQMAQDVLDTWKVITEHPDRPTPPSVMTPEEVELEAMRMLVAYVLARQEEAELGPVQVDDEGEQPPDAINALVEGLIKAMTGDPDAIVKVIKVEKVEKPDAPDPEFVKRVRNIARNQ